MDYNNQLTEIEVNRQNDLTQLDQQYQNAINETEQAYNKAADQYTIDANDGRTTAVEQLMETQTALTEQAVKEIEQQREQSEKDYIKEQAGAYADWQKQSDAYGVNAEKMASNGLTRSGYSESSQVQMYSDYQARVTSARDVFKRAELNFTNAITNARLQNNAALAQIALDAFQRQSEIALAGLTAKNGLLSEWTSQKLAVNTRYDNKYQTILDQIYREEQLRLQRDQMAQDAAQHAASLAQDQAQFDASLADKQADRDWQATQKQLDRDHEMSQYEAKTAAADKETKYNRLADLISSSGHEPTDAELKAAGMSRAEANSYLKYYKENKKTAGSTGGGGVRITDTGSGNGGVKLTGDDETGGYTVDDSVRVAGLGVPNPFPALGELGTGAGGNSGVYVPKTAAGESLITYEGTVAYLKQRGIPSSVASGLMTQSEWRRRKGSGSTSDDIKDFATYEEYLADKRDYLLYQYSQLKK